SLLSHLYHHPGRVVRKLNVCHDERDDDGVPRPTFGGAGHYDDDIPTEDRRFLGMAVADDHQTVAVARAVRGMTRPPFTAWDAVLFGELMAVARPFLHGSDSDQPAPTPRARFILSDMDRDELGCGD